MIQKFIARLVPFIFLGVMLVLFVLGLILFSYLLIIGAIVGMILFALTWLRDKIFPPKEIGPHQKKETQGRTFEHDDRDR